MVPPPPPPLQEVARRCGLTAACTPGKGGKERTKEEGIKEAHRRFYLLDCFPPAQKKRRVCEVLFLGEKMAFLTWKKRKERFLNTLAFFFLLLFLPLTFPLPSLPFQESGSPCGCAQNCSGGFSPSPEAQMHPREDQLFLSTLPHPVSVMVGKWMGKVDEEEEEVCCSTVHTTV